LNTSREHYAEICTTHTFDDRVETLRNVRKAGMELCSGGIIGMGEKLSDIVEMAFSLRELSVESIPLNFLHAIDGTPLEQKEYLNPRDCLRALCMMRFVNPKSELRIAGGRERHLRTLQPLGLFVANSIFVGDYLTTKGQAPDEDYQMIRDMGFEITGSCVGPESSASSCGGGNCEGNSCDSTSNSQVCNSQTNAGTSCCG
jgi:biotin synthase